MYNCTCAQLYQLPNFDCYKKQLLINFCNSKKNSTFARRLYPKQREKDADIVSVGKTTAQKEWVIVDATDQVLGRLASKVAKILRGKYKPCFTPNADCGDNVIIINADKVKLTGNKWSDKIYLTYTGYPGGQREITPAKLMQKGESKLFLKVIKGMLPKNRLGAQLLRNVYVYAGSEHPHAAQQPKTIDINTLK